MSLDPKTQSCSDCIFWKPIEIEPDGSQTGYCRVNPPTVCLPPPADHQDWDGNDLARSMTSHPVTFVNEWCGKFTERK